MRHGQKKEKGDTLALWPLAAPGHPGAVGMGCRARAGCSRSGSLLSGLPRARCPLKVKAVGSTHLPLPGASTATFMLQAPRPQFQHCPPSHSRPHVAAALQLFFTIHGIVPAALPAHTSGDHPGDPDVSVPTSSDRQAKGCPSSFRTPSLRPIPRDRNPGKSKEGPSGQLHQQVPVRTLSGSDHCSAGDEMS